MCTRVDGDGPEGDAQFRQQSRAGAGSSCGKIEDFDDGCPLRSPVDVIMSHDVVGSDACLPVSRACQRDECLALRDEVFDLDDVTDGVDIRVAGAQVFVHQDAVGGANCESSMFGYLRVWSYADSEDNHVCCKLCPAGQGYRQRTVHVLRKRFDSVTQVQVDTMDLQFLMSVGSDVGVEERQHLRQHLDQCDVDLPLPQVLCDFDADEAPSDNDSLPDTSMDGLDDTVHIGDGPERIDALTVDARDGWAQGRTAGRQDELVIPVGRLGAGGEFFYSDCVCLPINTGYLMPRQEVDIEPLLHRRRCLDKQLAAICNDIAYVIGKPTIGETDVVSLFVNDDLRLLVEAAQARCSRSSPGVSTNNDDSHVFLLFPCLLRLTTSIPSRTYQDSMKQCSISLWPYMTKSTLQIDNNVWVPRYALVTRGPLCHTDAMTENNADYTFFDSSRGGSSHGTP